MFNDHDGADGPLIPINKYFDNHLTKLMFFFCIFKYILIHLVSLAGENQLDRPLPDIYDTKA